MNVRQPIEKIGIFRALKLGDLLCAMPAIASLKAAFPKAEITLIGLESAAELCKRYASILDRLLPFPGYPGLPEQDFCARRYAAFLKQVRAEQFDLLLQMHGSGEIVNELCASFNPRQLAGFYLPPSSPPFGTFIPYPAGPVHESDRHLALLEALGISPQQREMFFPLTHADLGDFLARTGLDPALPYVCLHPGSADPARRWPLTHFERFGRLLLQSGYRIAITGTASERPLALQLGERLGAGASTLAGETSLGTLAAILKQSRGLLSNCTGVSHLAAALKVPSLIISMDGEPKRWGPKNKALHTLIDWRAEQDLEKCRLELQRRFPRLAESPGRSKTLGTAYC